MNILLTGSSGFLGQVIKANLLSFNVTTIGRHGGDLKADLSVTVPNLPSSFDLIIHSAGKAHSIPKNNAEVKSFFSINVNGTGNLLKALEKSSLPKYFVFISSIAVYGLSNGHLLNESTPTNAKDPYGLSKIQAESLIQNWCKVNGVICTILRLPIILGPNPPGNLKAMIQGIQKGYYFNIGGGRARKSMVLAQDISRIIPKAAKLGGIYNLTDGYNPTFSELSCLIAKQLGKSKPHNIPMWLAKVAATFGNLLGPAAPINSSKLQKITSDLTFDDTKARILLGWNPENVLTGFKISLH